MSMSQVEINTLETGRTLSVSASGLTIMVQIKTEDNTSRAVDLSVPQAEAFKAALTEGIKDANRNYH